MKVRAMICAAAMATAMAASAQADTGKPAKIYFLGHGSLRVESPGGTVIYIDPYAGEGYDVAADYVLVTHEHGDHNKIELVAERNPDFRVIRSADALIDGKYQTFKLGDVDVEAVQAGYNKNHDETKCVGYILTFPDGKKVYVSGDTSTTPQMREMASLGLDYAFLCMDGVYNMDIPEAEECARLIKAKHVIPYHNQPGSLLGEERADRFQADGKIILHPGEILFVE